MSEENKTESPKEELKQDKKEVAPPQQKSVDAMNTGELRGTSLDEQWRLACAFLKSGMLPKAYKTPEQVLVGMQFAYELGLKPLMAMRQIAVINGQPSLWGELPLGLVRRSGQLVYFNEWFVDKDYKEICFENKNLNDPIFAALCELERKGMSRKVYSFTQKDKHNLGIAAIWNSFEKIMMKRKARSIGLKDQFGDIIEGMPIAEYDYHIMGDEGMEQDNVPQSTQEAKLNNFKNKFKKKESDNAIEAEGKKVDE